MKQWEVDSMRNGRTETVRCGPEAGPRASRELETFLGLNKCIFLALALVPLLFLNGCTGYAGGNPHLPPIANFAISPASLNFGTVASGQKTSQNIKLTNMGKVALTIQ